MTNLAFDQRGTLYVLHADRLYISFDQGESFRFVHALPKWGNDPSVGDGGSAQFFVVDGGTIHIGLKEASPDGASRIWYLRGKHEAALSAIGTSRGRCCRVAPRWHGSDRTPGRRCRRG